MSAAGRAAHERASLSRESVLEAALAIADLEGLDALTMRRLAADLGAAPMALYRYFRNKDELVISLFDCVISAYEAADHHHADWREEIRSSFRWFRRTLVDHPGVMPVLSKRVGVGNTSDRITESVLLRLRSVACDDREAARAFFALVGYAVGFAALETAALAQRRDAGIDNPDEWLRLSRLRFESLPSSSYPSLVDLAPFIGEYWTDAQFEDGLGRLIESVDPGPK